MIYQFKTTATMKPYNNKKWWIDDGIIREITVNADTIFSNDDFFSGTEE